MAALFGAIVTLTATTHAALLSATSATTDMGSNFGTNLNNTINGVGLSSLSLTATHASTSPGNSWVAGAVAGNITFSLGSTVGLSGFSFWNQNGGGPGGAGSTGIQNLLISSSTDNVTFTLIPGAPTTFAQDMPSIGTAQQFTFGTVAAGFVRFSVQTNYGYPQTGFAEVQFDAGAVPPAATPALAVLFTASAPLVTITIVDLGAVFSTLESGLPLAVTQRQILLNTLQTATRDVGGRLFLLRAGLLLDGGSSAGAAGPTGREMVRLGSDGKTLSEGKDYQAAPEEPFRRWELFGGGDYGKFDVDDTGSLRGHDSEVAVATVGAEYRFNKYVVVGLAASYIRSDTDISRGIGGLTVEGMAFSAYGSAVWRDFYFDLLYSYGALAEDIQRRTLVGRTAHGDVENRSNALQFNTGYTLRFGQVRTGPLASLEWIHGELEGYQETGGGSAALEFPGQTYDSLVSRFGWQASYTAKTGFGTITPQVRASWDHEYLNSTESVSATLLDSPFTTITGSTVTKGGKFSAAADTAQPGRDFLNLGAGLSVQLGDRIFATVQYETHLFQSSASAHLGSARFSLAF